jgi:hypothetical protein
VKIINQKEWHMPPNILLTGLSMVWKGGGTPFAGGGRGGGPPIVTIVLVVSKMLKKLHDMRLKNSFQNCFILNLFLLNPNIAYTSGNLVPIA